MDATNLEVSLEQLSHWRASQAAYRGSRNQHLFVRLVGDIQVDILRESFNDVVNRHDLLQRSFNVFGSNLYFGPIEKDWSIDFTIIDLTTVPLDEREPQALETGRAMTRIEYDLSAPPLFSARLFKINSDQYILFLLIDHLVCDGWSASLFVKELSEFYNARLGMRQARLRPLLQSFVEQTPASTAAALDNDTPETRRFWTELLGPPATGPRWTRADGAATGSTANHDTLVTHRERWSAETSRRLQEASLASGLTLFCLTLTAFGIALRELTGQHDFLLTTAVAGRQTRRKFYLIGLFRKIILLRFRPNRASPLSQQARDVNEMISTVFSHQEGPTGRYLIASLLEGGDLAAEPHCTTSFIWQNYPGGGISFDGIESEEILAEFAGGDEELDAFYWMERGQVHGVLKHDVNVFSVMDITALGALVERAARDLAESLLEGS